MVEYQGPVILSLNAANMVSIGVIAVVDLLVLALLLQLFMRSTGRSGGKSPASASTTQ